MFFYLHGRRDHPPPLASERRALSDGERVLFRQALNGDQEALDYVEGNSVLRYYFGRVAPRP